MINWFACGPDDAVDIKDEADVDEWDDEDDNGETVGFVDVLAPNILLLLELFESIDANDFKAKLGSIWANRFRFKLFDVDWLK